jgi:hypothetical protein
LLLSLLAKGTVRISTVAPHHPFYFHRAYVLDSAGASTKKCAMQTVEDLGKFLSSVLGADFTLSTVFVRVSTYYN